MLWAVGIDGLLALLAPHMVTVLLRAQDERRFLEVFTVNEGGAAALATLNEYGNFCKLHFSPDLELLFGDTNLFDEEP